MVRPLCHCGKPRGERVNLGKQALGLKLKIHGVAVNPHVRHPHRMHARVLLPLCINQVTVGQAEHGAVGEKLVEVSLRETRRPSALYFASPTSTTRPPRLQVKSGRIAT